MIMLNEVFNINNQYSNNVFRENVVFGNMPIGNPADITLNMIEHINTADYILIESHREFEWTLKLINELNLSTSVKLNPKAKIVQFDLDSSKEEIDKLINDLIEKSRDKKLLAISDEGSSIFLEPMSMLKTALIQRKLPFQVVPGPNAVISSAVNFGGPFNVVEFYFGSSYPALSNQEKKITFDRIKYLNVETIFLLRAEGMKNYITEMKNELDSNWFADFAINLSMPNETHIMGEFDKILKFIDENKELFEYDRNTKKFAILIFPKNKTNGVGNYPQIG